MIQADHSNFLPMLLEAEKCEHVATLNRVLTQAQGCSGHENLPQHWAQPICKATINSLLMIFDIECNELCVNIPTVQLFEVVL